jgi:uncharacterized protein YbaR (Trm112 family)
MEDAMTIAAALLSNLVCPVSGQSLSAAKGKKLSGLLRQVSEGKLVPMGSVDWQVEELTGLLITADRKGAYPIIDGVAVLLPASFLRISA